MPDTQTLAAGTDTSGTLRARLKRVTWEGPGVISLDFVPLEGGAFPAFEPGAHVDVHLPGGVLRSYSLCGDPADRGQWRIAVREVEGGRGSRVVHRDLRPGMEVTLGTPRNNFAFLDADHYLFVAGGIGITPLLPMMRAATERGRDWTLLLCSRDPDAPFTEEARALGGEVVTHVSRLGTRLDVAARLAQAQPNTLLYCCGPEALMNAVEGATAAWPEGSVRFEWFQPKSRPEGEVSAGFEVVCAASGQTLHVPEDRSLLDVLNDAGIDVPRSCEQGVCGTCECRVLEGAVDHRDSILSESERAANDTMMVCVSRAAGKRLVLDV